jgi:hypothetical protein
MSLIRVPNSPYFHVVLIVNGKRYQKSAKTASRAQAKAFESKWHNELLRQAAFGEAEAITVAEATRLFLAAHKNNVNFSNLRAHCERFGDHFGKQTDLAAITTTDFNRFLVNLAEELQPGTINQITQQFRQLVAETSALGYATPRIDYPKRLKVKRRHGYSRRKKKPRSLTTLPPYHACVRTTTSSASCSTPGRGSTRR